MKETGLLRYCTRLRYHWSLTGECHDSTLRIPLVQVSSLSLATVVVHSLMGTASLAIFCVQATEKVVRMHARMTVGVPWYAG